MLASLRRSLWGLLLAIALGVVLGGWRMGRFQRFERVGDPILQLFRQTSALALFPVFIQKRAREERIGEVSFEVSALQDGLICHS